MVWGFVCEMIFAREDAFSRLNDLGTGGWC